MNAKVEYVDARKREYYLDKAECEDERAPRNEATWLCIYLASVVAADRAGYTPLVASMRADITISIINPINFRGISFFTNI